LRQQRVRSERLFDRSTVVKTLNHNLGYHELEDERRRSASPNGARSAWGDDVGEVDVVAEIIERTAMTRSDEDR